MPTKISKWFWDYEVARSYEAERREINNEPSQEVLRNASFMATNCMDLVRDHYGPIAPFSWYRCERLERELTWNKGFEQWCRKTHHLHNERSWPTYFALKSHPRGEAVDFKVAHVTTLDLFIWVVKNIPDFDQCILEFVKDDDPYSGWVHLSCKYNFEGNRKQKFELG